MQNTLEIYLYNIQKKEEEVEMIQELLADTEVRKQKSKQRMTHVPGEIKIKEQMK